ncbi:MAG: branched-chain amino acid ABC transporter permease, partial [Gemmatimonadales bacterium]
MTVRRAPLRLLADQTLLRHLTVAVAGAVILYFLTTGLSGFRQYQIANIAFYLVAVAGLTVLVGLNGQISIGHGAFMAIGAYLAALIIRDLGWPIAGVFAACAAGTAVAGAIVGAAAARLHGPYLAGATLMLAVALPALATRYSGLFGGDQGLTVTITAPRSLGPVFPLTRWQAWVTCAAALVALLLLANLKRSRVGRSFRAVRDDEVAAALAGLAVARVRILAFVVSAASAGLAGSMLAVTTGLV